jgi:hypothetical protein
MRSASPSSVVSMSSSMREAAYREEYGRHLNNYSEVYRLPADTEELERLRMYLVSMPDHPIQSNSHINAE